MPVEIDSLAVIIITLFLLVTLGVLLGSSFLVDMTIGRLRRDSKAEEVSLYSSRTSGREVVRCWLKTG